MVTPAGEVVEVTEEQPEFLQAMRSSYGLFGIVYEVTFRVKPLRSMAVCHKTYHLDTFERELPALKAQGDSLMMCVNPCINKITLSTRSPSSSGAIATIRTHGTPAGHRPTHRQP